MLHFRITYQRETKAFLVEYDSKWALISKKTSELFGVPAKHVALLHTDSDGALIQITNHDELRSYILGPRSARAVAGLPLDFDLKDTREWKYSIISQIEAPEHEDADYEKPDEISPIMSPTTGKFADEDYTFVQPPALDASDMVHVVVPGHSPYAVPRPRSNVDIHLVETKGEEEGQWDELRPPSANSGNSIEYPNVYLDEPPKPLSVASSGPPRIPAEKKGKGRMISSQPFTGNPQRPPSHIEIASDKSVVNNDVPRKHPIHIVDVNYTSSPIPLISNIVKKMSLEDARARTIFDGEETPAPKSAMPRDGGEYGTLVTQLVSLVDVVSHLLEDETVAHQVRDAWEGFTNRDKNAPEPPSPTTTLGFGSRDAYSRKSKEFALAEGLVGVMKKVATIVEDDASDIEERDDHVVWTHRSHGLTDIRLPKLDHEKKLTSPVIKTPKSKGPPVANKSSKQRLEEAKAAYKAEKARYRSEREQKRRDRMAAKGLMYPEPTTEAKEIVAEPVPIISAPLGRRASLMSVPSEHPSNLRARIAEVMGTKPQAPSTVKPSAGSTYSPALLPQRVSHSVAAMSMKTPTIPDRPETGADDSAVDGDSEGPGTPKPSRPARGSAQFDFDAFMENNAWPPQDGSPFPEKHPFPRSAKVSMNTVKHPSMLPPPRVYMQTGMVLDPISGLVPSDHTATPTPPPRPTVFSPSLTPPLHVRNGMETMLADAFRANPVPRNSLKRRWADERGSRRMDVGGRNVDSIAGDPHPPPVYSTDGEGDGDAILEVGEPMRGEKGVLPLNEEFKRRCMAVLYEYNVTQAVYPNLDVLIAQGIQLAGSNRQMVRLAAESNHEARETFLSEEVPNVVNRVLAAVQRGSTPNYV